MKTRSTEPKIEWQFPDVGLVELMLGARMSKEDIAKYFGLPMDVFEKRFADTIRTRGARSVGELAAMIYSKAKNGDLEAIATIAELNAMDSAKWPPLDSVKWQ